jgi:hypothetical protein
MGEDKRRGRDPFEGHLSYRDPGIVVDAELPRKVERLRRWFRVYSDAAIVELMQAAGLDIIERAEP